MLFLTTKILHSDEEAARKKKKKARFIGERVGLVQRPQLSYSLENINRVKKTTPIVKQITVVSQPDGSLASKENAIKEPKEV